MNLNLKTAMYFFFKRDLSLTLIVDYFKNKTTITSDPT